MSSKRYSTARPIKGFATQLTDAFAQAEEHLGSLGVIHFGKEITSTANNHTVTFYRYANGWAWRSNR